MEKKFKYIKKFNEDIDWSWIDEEEETLNFSIIPLLFKTPEIISKIKWLKDEILERYTDKFYSIPIYNNQSNNKIRTINDQVFLYDHVDDKLFIKGRSLGGIIYYKGKWAEAVEKLNN